jgi:hypothetical protein
MKRKNVTMMIVMVAVTSVITCGCDKNEEKVLLSKNEQKTETPKETKQNIITYETLRQWTIPAGGVGMQILVSDEATKDEVLSLAKHLRSNSSPKNFFILHIFDLEEAFLNRDNPDYSDEKYFKHFLVSAVRNPKTGYNKINWMAEGRDH